MKKNSLLLLAGLGAAGLLSGYSAKRITADPATATEASLPGGQRAHGGNSLEPAVLDRPSRPRGRADAAGIRSNDTLETLKEVPPEDLYRRLALWMLDASEPEIAAWWQHYRSLPNRSNEINDLIFINWARIDPQAAVTAAAGTPDEHYSWWAWACHDPAGSLAAVMAQNPDRLNNVTWGLGEFHPDWVREHWDEIPETGQQNALQGMAKWDDVGNPLEILTFLKEKGYGFHPGIFKVLISKDPWAAYDMIQEGGGQEFSRFRGSIDSLGTFVEIVAEQHPEMLEKLAAQTPSGELKRKMEANLFASLLNSDPEAAKQQALENPAPKVAVDQLTAVGLNLLSSDPDQAFVLAGRIFALDPEALDGMTRVTFEGGGNGWGNGAPEVNRLMNGLIARDPARAMEGFLPTGEQTAPSAGFYKVAQMWVDQDLEGYAGWVNDQTDTTVHSRAVSVMINKLSNEQNFADAAEWSLSLTEERDRTNHLGNLMRNWARTDAESAAVWLESADLSAEEAELLQKQLPTNP